MSSIVGVAVGWGIVVGVVVLAFILYGFWRNMTRKRRQPVIDLQYLNINQTNDAPLPLETNQTDDNSLTEIDIGSNEQHLADAQV